MAGGLVFAYNSLWQAITPAYCLRWLKACRTKDMILQSRLLSKHYHSCTLGKFYSVENSFARPCSACVSCKQRYTSYHARRKYPVVVQVNRSQVQCEELLQRFRRFCSSNRSSSSSRSHIESSHADPFTLTEKDLETLSKKIRKELNTSVVSLREVSHYYFDGQGKNIRPMIVLLMAGACNYHTGQIREILASQQTVVMISEMIHTASLIHDDVIDGADSRRNKTSVNKLFGDNLCVVAGDYILSCASQALAKLGNPDVVELLAKVVDDLVRGEVMQLGSKEDPDERFNHYLQKTFKKTASLIACCCKAVAVFGQCSQEVQDIAYQYGLNIGMTFQLVDDVLDFVASEEEMGKPTATDLTLGLATAPVLFACEKFPDLNSLIMRRFKEPGDVQIAWEAVKKSDGVSQTYTLAEKYAREAVRQIDRLASSPEKQALVQITKAVIQRRK